MKIRSFANIQSLLFDNLTVKQTVSKNIFWLAITEGMNKMAKLVLLVYVARILGATEYGKFTFALAFVSLFIIFFDFGLPQITTRELSRDKEKEKEFPAVLSLKIFFGLGTLFLILIVSFFITSDIAIQKIIWILAACFFIEGISDLIVAFFRARQKMEYEAFIKTLGSLVFVAMGLFTLFYFPSILNLSYSYLFGVLVALIFALTLFWLKVQKPSFVLNKSAWQKFLSLSWPLGLIAIATTIYNQIDSVMMGLWGQITQVGWYNAAYKIVWPILIPATLISVSLFPVLSRYFKESKEKLQNAWSHQIETMILLAIPVMTGGVILAPRIIDFVYDPSFIPSILAFQILVVMIGIIFIYNAFYQVLIAADQQKKIFWAVLSGAIINIILNLILIPKFSLYGAAFATVITHLLILFLLVRFTVTFTPIKPFNFKFLLNTIVILFSSAIMCFVITQPQVYNLHVLLSILVGILAYFVAILIFKYMINYFSHHYSLKMN